MNDILEKIVAGLRGLGVEPGDTLLVHSSLSSLGWVDGGAETVIKALIVALPEGTLLMPALDWRYVNKEHPYFSVRETPSNVGVIPETFRKYPGVIRSLHPLHSVCAYGVNAAEITSSHYLDRTPVGENSPFRLLMKYSGKILMLGCGLRPMTFMHGVEEAAGLPYVLEDEPTKISVEDYDGKVEEVFHRLHYFRGYGQRYERVADCMEIARGKVLDADAYLLDALTLWNSAGKKVREVPFYFVDEISGDEE